MSPRQRAAVPGYTVARDGVGGAGGEHTNETLEATGKDEDRQAET